VRAPAAAVTAWPAAGSPLTADLLADSAPLVALGVFPTAVYLGGRQHREVLPLLTADALLLPTGLRLAEPSHRVGWGLEPGNEVEVHAGGLRWPGRLVHVARQWRPAPVPAPGVPVPGETLGPVAADLAGLASSTVLLRRARNLCAAVTDGGAVTYGTVDDLVHGLVGLGAGLTPAGDDVLCGVLLTLRATGRVRDTERLAAAVGATLHRTTSISASLLDAAVRGFATPAVTDLVRAVARGDRDAVRTLLPAVLAVGHSSGADLVAGVAGAALALAHRPRTEPSRDAPPRDAPTGDADRKVDQ
jgi:Protein of unknown function (DUF2877)